MTYHSEMLPFPQQFCRVVMEDPEGSGNIVRLADDVRNAVVYLGFSDPSNPDAFDPEGTGFLIGDGRHNYLVTADHVAKKLGDGGFCVRLNESGSGLARNQLIEHAVWHRHPTTPLTVDIAVLEYEIPDWAVRNFIPRKAFLSDFKLGTKDIGPGDLAYVLGIFEPLFGKRRNIPAVHTGHVCLIPEDEPIPVLDWNSPNPRDHIEVEAYLVEAPNTLPGSSGGPVFVRRSIKTRLFDKDVDPNPHGIQQWVHGSLWLLGVWSDSWFGDPAKELRIPSGKSPILPLGIGVTVPAKKLIEILDQPVLLAKRKGFELKTIGEHLPHKTGIRFPTTEDIGDEILRTMLNTPPEPSTKPKDKTTRKKRVSSVNKK